MKRILCLLPWTLGSICAQTVIPNGAPASYLLDGRVNEWTTLPPTLTLRATRPGGRHGPIWIRQTPEGLLIAGAIDGPAPDHVEVGLAPPAPPSFPPIAYGGQSQEVPVIEACGDEAKCREWFQSVLVHRRMLERTFVRRYSMGSAGVSEEFARPAYEQLLAAIEPNFRRYVAAVIPTGAPVFRSATRGDGAYTFESLIPWEAFPPFDSLRLNQFRLMVDVFDRNQRADPASFQPVVLATGRQFRITACDYPLEDGALFFPQRNDNLKHVFRLRNFESIYSYYLSPITEVTDFVEKPMPARTAVCGPQLSIARNGGIQRFDLEVDPSNLEVKLEPDGAYLALSGPTWKRATQADDDGCCEGLPSLRFGVWRVSTGGEIQQIFESHVIMSGIALGIVDMGVEASPDAKKVTIFVAMFSQVDHGAHWNSATYCRDGMAYKACGGNPDSRAPRRHWAH